MEPCLSLEIRVWRRRVEVECKTGRNFKDLRGMQWNKRATKSSRRKCYRSPNVPSRADWNIKPFELTHKRAESANKLNLRGMDGKPTTDRRKQEKRKRLCSGASQPATDTRTIPTAREMYAVIEREDPCNRRAHALEYMNWGLAILDFVFSTSIFSISKARPRRSSKPWRAGIVKRDGADGTPGKSLFGPSFYFSRPACRPGEGLCFDGDGLCI